MRRAPFLFLALVLAPALVGCGERGGEETTRATTRATTGTAIERGPRPVVLVTLDTTRADRLQPYGADDIATPTLLRLAREGVVFEQAMAVAPITLVAHTSLLTGLYPPRHGVRNNGIHFVADELRTLAEGLAERGYETAAFVSASVLEARYGLGQGFAVYDDDLSSGANRQARVVPDRAAGATVDAARAWLDGLDADRPADADATPFFLWVHFYDPHALYSPPPPYRDRYRERPYDGEIAYMDAELGRLLEHPALGDAAVAVIGDHGESLGEHGEQTHAILAYQATLHVPFLLSLPGGPAGLRVAEPVSQVDLAPTLLDLLGLTPADVLGRPLDGVSLLPRLEAGELPPRSTPIYAETYLPYYTYGWAKLRVLRRGAWKLIDGPDAELYRLSKDPDERSDLAALDAERLAELRSRLAALVGDRDEREAPLELDDEARERLRSLGYLASGVAPRERTGPRPDPKAYVDLHVGLERARALLRERRPAEAERQLRRVLERDASNLAALTELAAAREMTGDLDGAAEAVERALDLDPGDARLYVLMARLEQRRARSDQALELLDAVLELSPRHLDARLEKISLLGRRGETDRARALLAAARDDEGEHPRMLLAGARLDPAAPDAEARIRRALELDPHLVQGWRHLGLALEARGDVQGAEGAYREGLERAPDDADLHAQLGRLLARTGGDAEIHLREALRLSSAPRPEVLVALGAHLAERGRVQEALELYDRALADDPHHLGARNNRAVALYRAGQLDDALAALEALAREHPRHADAHNNLAALALDRGLWRDASRHARRAIDARPDHADAWLNLALSHHEAGRPAEAERAYRRGLEIEPDHLMARFHLGRLLAERRQASSPDEAAALLRQVASEAPTFAEPHLLLGELYAGPLGEPRRARAHLNAFVRLAESSAPDGARDDPRLEAVRRLIAELSLIAGAS